MRIYLIHGKQRLEWLWVFQPRLLSWNPECRYHSRFEPPADFRPPGPNPLADMDPPSQIWTPYQTFLLSIVCIIFDN